jgi:beta-xylosidase
VITEDMPDPFVLDTGDTYYLYSTSSAGVVYPYAVSRDLVRWASRGSSMPTIPAWALDRFWAPEVTKTSAGYSMYFTAQAANITRPDGQGAQCVGVAVSQSPDGPFVASGTEPLVCQAEQGGTIDASVVRDTDDSLWLIYKNDGNCCSLPVRFFMRRMSEDGLTFAGEEVEVEGVVPDRRWEGIVVEAPTIHHHEDTYYLFYSANAYDSAQYAVGYATSSDLTGPYTEAQENPILESVRGVGPFGPGHQALIKDRDGDLWIIYHSWESTSFQRRQVWIDELVFEGGKPVVQGPDVEPQPVP